MTKTNRTPDIMLVAVTVAIIALVVLSIIAIESLTTDAQDMTNTTSIEIVDDEIGHTRYIVDETTSIKCAAGALVDISSPIDDLTTFLAGDSTDEHVYEYGIYDCLDYSTDLANNLTAAGFDAGCVLVTPLDYSIGGHMVTRVTLAAGDFIIEPIDDKVSAYGDFVNSTDLENYIIFNLSTATAEMMRDEARICGLMTLPHDEEVFDHTIDNKRYNELWYNETSPENVREFLSLLPVCPWFKPGATNVCGLAARYMSIEAHQHGLSLDSTTVVHMTGVSGGHRVNVFRYDGVDYYTTNLYSGDTRVLTRGEMYDALRCVMGDVALSLDDYEIHDGDWFERNGY